ncbi:MAG: hypothetical protein HOB38_16750 [Deltaproteobacteria bacterium]|nr:hypothetical protein [Deltaproteobacteria bacterium]
MKIGRFDFQTLSNLLHAIYVIGTAAIFQIQQAASDASEKNRFGFVIFDFMQATLSTTIAKRFPLIERHFAKRFAFPEWLVFQLHFDVLPGRNPCSNAVRKGQYPVLQQFNPPFSQILHVMNSKKIRKTRILLFL